MYAKFKRRIAVIFCIVAVFSGLWVVIEGREKPIVESKHNDHTVFIGRSGKVIKIKLIEDRSSPFLLSAYQFYEGSDSVTSAAVQWSMTNSFLVKFNNGINLDCNWNVSGVSWAMH